MSPETPYNLDDQVKELLVPLPKWPPEGIDVSQPYGYEIRRDEKVLSYNGVLHAYDPDHFIIGYIKAQWEKFLQETEGKDRIVIIEGGAKPRELPANEEEAIRNLGESELMRYYAVQNDIQWISPEPTLTEYTEMMEELGKKYEREEVEYALFARTAATTAARHLNEKDYTEYMTEHVIPVGKKRSPWPDFDYTYKHMQEIHKRITGRDWDRGDEEIFRHLASPVGDRFVTNQILGEMGIARDVKITSEILRLWEEGKSLFIVYGLGHAIKQEKAIKELAS